MNPYPAASAGASAIQTVVFVCAHGAAKSVLAGSYFNLLAAQQGIPARAIARGTEPDAEVSERVRLDVDAVGATLCVEQPTRLMHDDIANADLLVAFDLDEHELGAVPQRSWNSLPPLSGDFERARAAIVAHVQELVAELKDGPERHV